MTYAPLLMKFRSAYHESVQLGNELTQKMNENVLNNENNNSIDSENDDNNDDFENSTQKASKKIKQWIEINDNSLDDKVDVLLQNSKYKNLFELDFMKKAKERQNLKAKDEAKALLLEMQDYEISGIQNSDPMIHSDSDNVKDLNEEDEGGDYDNIVSNQASTANKKKKMNMLLKIQQLNVLS